MIQERRGCRRYRGRIPIVSSDAEGLNFSFISELGRDSAYIETEKLIPIGARLPFVISNGKRQAPVSARVMRVRDAFIHGGKSGMAVRFEGMNEVSRSIRDDLLLYLMSLRHHQFWNAA